MKPLMQPQKKALSIGTVMIDIITVIADNDIELMTLHNMTSSFLMLEQGRKIESQSIETYVGGGAANTAVCMSRLGMDMDILGIVGDDLNGEKIVKRLTEENIDQAHLITDPHDGSGVAVHISSHDRNAAIFTHRGANCSLTNAQVEAVDFNKYDLIYITNLSNQSADHFPLVIQRAAQANCFVASNPGIRQLTRLCDDFLAALPSISLLSINKVECETLVPKLIAEDHKHAHATLCHPEYGKQDDPAKHPPLLKSGFQFGGFSLGLVDCMKILSNHGPDYVVITDGSKGAYLMTGDYLYYCPPQEVVMRGSAGAGDSFSSTLASLIAAGNDPDVALYAASANAVSVISHVDTQEGLLPFDHLNQNIKSEAQDGAIICWKVT